jgi:hypothetical protein
MLAPLAHLTSSEPGLGLTASERGFSFYAQRPPERFWSPRIEKEI